MSARGLALLGAVMLCASCGGGSPGSGGGTTVGVPAPTPTPTPTPPPPVTGVTVEAPLATFSAPWSLAPLPDGRFLVTQRSNPGALFVVGRDGTKLAVDGLPANIGLLDVKLAADFATSGFIYLSYMERDVTAPRFGRAAGDPAFFPERMAVLRARLSIGSTVAQLQLASTIFRQEPYIVTYSGSGEPGGRIAPSPDGRYVFITSGDRQELDASLLFSTANTLGKTIRILPDGQVPADNPFASQPGGAAIWSLGHRNAYGLAFAPDGTLWSSEMGPAGGDELNQIRRGENYGWPAVSNGNHYDGGNIPDHAPGDGFAAPAISWTPVIAPAGMIFYSGTMFGDWRGDAILTGLQSRGLVRVRLSGSTATEMQRISLGERVRDVAQAADGSLWVLTDGSAGKLQRLTPTF